MTPEETTNLLRIAGAGNLELLRRAIDHGCPVNLANDLGYTLLMSACASYRVGVVTFLLDSSADIRLRTTDGRTALHAAVSASPSLPVDQAECVRQLLVRGAEVDAQDQSGITPLMSAAWFGCVLSVKELLGHQAMTDLRDCQGRTAADVARSRKRADVLALLEKG